MLDHVVFAFVGTSVQASPRGLEKTCLDLLLVSYNNVLKEKNVNVQVKLTSFYFLEKNRKFRVYLQRLGLNIFGEFLFGFLIFRFLEKGFHGSNIILNFV